MKGMAILGLFRIVKELAGKDRIGELIAGLPASDQSLYERPILAGEWYPYEAYANLLAAVTRSLGGGRHEFTASLGRSAAEMDVGTIFKIVSVILSPRRALQAAGMLWSRYCDTGRFVMTRIDDESGEGHIESFLGISSEHERLLTGWIEGIGSAAGAREPQVTLVASVHGGAPVTGYRMRWANQSSR
jgi:hypothetical protein